MTYYRFKNLAIKVPKTKISRLLDIKNEIDTLFSKTTTNLNKTFKNMNSAEVTYNAFLDYDIPPHHFMMLGDFMYITSTRSNDDNTLKKTKKVERYIADKFNKSIKSRILSSWNENSLLTERMELLNQTMACYDQGFYGPVVNVFATQLEGVIKQKVNKQFDKVTTNDLKNIVNILFSKKGVGSHDLTSAKYYADKVVSSNKNRPSNRHAIAHGNIANYTKEIDAIRMILIFDCIVARLDKTDKDLLVTVLDKKKIKYKKSERS
ncbi:hypothetical protein ACW7DJ_02250 [Mammaliicoccus sciuri]